MKTMTISRRTTTFLSAVAIAALSACSSETPKVSDTAAPVDTAAPAPAAVPAAPTTGMIDPGTAARTDLAGLPGMSDSLAGELIASRPYTNMLAVDKVLAKHLSETQRDSVYTRLWIPIDINKASKEEILLIPGVGPKMLHEFEEYRPYTSMEQFRREIGKYVDNTELARLETFVAIKP